MLKEIERSFRSVESYRMEAVFGHGNILHVLFQIEEQYYLATIVVDNIVLGYSRVFESSFCLIERSSTVRKMLRMGVLGFRVMTKDTEGKRVEGVILAVRTVCLRSLYLFTLFKSESVGLCEGVSIMTDLQDLRDMRASFYEESKTVVVISNQGSIQIHYTLKKNGSI
jgi:hypothetical protein